MVKTIDIYKASKQINNYHDEFYKTVVEFRVDSQKWAFFKGYNNYILKPTVIWTEEYPFRMDFTLEVLEYIKD